MPAALRLGRPGAQTANIFVPTERSHPIMDAFQATEKQLKTIHPKLPNKPKTTENKKSV